MTAHAPQSNYEWRRVILGLHGYFFSVPFLGSFPRSTEKGSGCVAVGIPQRVRGACQHARTKSQVLIAPRFLGDRRNQRDCKSASFSIKRISLADFTCFFLTGLCLKLLLRRGLRRS